MNKIFLLIPIILLLISCKDKDVNNLAIEPVVPEAIESLLNQKILGVVESIDSSEKMRILGIKYQMKIIEPEHLVGQYATYYSPILLDKLVGDTVDIADLK